MLPFRDSNLPLTWTILRCVEPMQSDCREGFCAVVVNFFYERQLLFRFGRNRKIQILNFMRLIGSPGFLKSLAHALL